MRRVQMPAVKAAFDSPQGASIMRNLGQMNQFVAPQQEDSGQQTDFIGGATTLLEVPVRLTISRLLHLSSTK
ncbi:hypothetical protein BANRA_05508 [Klebsiella pneumoniae]|uniref:hypothetical protein n=1 Tax=Klebsiella pneumoniae TaxID=573 RepID=UPI000F262D46|nr:hypothetical protein [Klebsiella pneumoniae]VCY93384.1 hypothetical protein BANRA_05508 [Klebsiella pneumoniae]